MMEALLDAAAAAALLDQPEAPDFDIPEEYASIPTDELLELRVSPAKGSGQRGYFALQNIAAGTLLMVCKPVAMVMGWQDDTVEVSVDGDEDAMDDSEMNPRAKNDHLLPPNEEPRINELLLLKILDKLKEQPSLWSDALSQLFPRTSEDLSGLPAWVCADDEVFVQIETSIQELQKIPQLASAVKDISKRLPLIIRYNILSVETCPELLSHPGDEGHASLSAVALYHLPSFFNHSRTCNCSRYAIGDVAFFVANQDIPMGSEVCISYIEHDVLCESAHRRNNMLAMNFDDTGADETVTDVQPDDGPDMPVVDSEVQNELMATDAFERLSDIEELLGQATGAKLPDEDADDDDGQLEEGAPADAVMEGTGTPWFQCDVHNLRILKAITLESMGQSKEALELWEASVLFTEMQLPPLDESSVVMRVQAALSAWRVGDATRAKHHAAVALRTHSLLFGGGVSRFRRRMGPDLRLSWRPQVQNPDPTSKAEVSPVDVLWPL